MYLKANKISFSMIYITYAIFEKRNSVNIKLKSF